MTSKTISTIYPSFVGSTTVLNDGGSPNDGSPNVLTVALTNANLYHGIETARDIQITSGDNLAFYFIADDPSTNGARERDGHKFILNWALTSLDNMCQIKHHLYLPGESVDYKHLRQGTPSGWEVDKDQPNIKRGNLSKLYGWKLKPSTPFTLKPGQSILLVLSNIVCDLPDGPSMAYVSFLKMKPDKNGGPPQPETHFERCGPIQKTPNIISGDKVGIGIVDPQFPLSIETGEGGPKISLWNTNAEEFHGFSVDSGQTGYHVPTNYNRHTFYVGGTGTQENPGTEIVRIQGSGDANTTGSDYIPLAITPSKLGPKITLWDGGNEGAYHGLSISEGQMNYHVNENSADHVFYAGGDGTINNLGTELIRIRGNGGTENSGISLLAITSKNWGPKIALWDGGKAGAYDGLSISSNQMNYHVNGNQIDHVFYAGGDGTINNLGTELVRVSGGGLLKIHGDKKGIELGAGVVGKQPDAGKIVYQGFPNYDSLDIVGAGNSISTRRVTIYAEGGMNLNGGRINLNGERIDLNVERINLNGLLRHNDDPLMLTKECKLKTKNNKGKNLSFDTKISWSKYIATLEEGSIKKFNLAIKNDNIRDGFLSLVQGGNDTWILNADTPLEDFLGGASYDVTVTVIAFHRSFFE